MVGLACPGLAGALLWPRSGNGVLEIGVGKKLNRSLSLDYPRNFLPKDPNEAKDARREIAYFDNTKERMRYAHFKAQGLFAGSGVIEAACKTVVGQRLKQSGMEWTVDGANASIALRCTE